MRHLSILPLVGAAFILTACADASPLDPAAAPAFGVAPGVTADMSNFVALGTSVSMGWTSDGVLHTGQERSWVSQLAEQVGVGFTVPAIAAPGCQPPFAAPLISFRRTDGSSVAASRASCSPNLPGVSLPTQNLAVEGATAGDALTSTPETATGGRGPVTSRVLPSGTTQVAAMLSQNPTFVSVEFGGNEVLPAQVGLLYPGVTFTPFAVFSANYSAVIEQVKATGAHALLVSLPTDLRNFPTLRTGPEIASQRSAFAQYNVTVSANCDDSANWIFVRGKVMTAVGEGLQRAAMGAPPATLSCADVPGTPDYVLTPGDVAALNDLVGRMNAFIREQADANGYATFSLGVLYDRSKEDVPFDLVTYLHSAEPYGTRISLDGVHPSAAGHRVLARAARVAIQQTYGSPALAAN